MPPAEDTLRWSHWHNDAYSGLEFGSATFKVCTVIVLSFRIVKLQSLFDTVIHEMAHGILDIRGINGLHGKHFQGVVSDMVKVLRKNVKVLCQILDFDVVIDKKAIARTRIERKYNVQ